MKTKTTTIFIIFIILFASTIFVSCKYTKYVPDGQHLLNSVQIESNNRDIKLRKIKKIITQKPNRKNLVFFKDQLILYNALYTEKEEGIRSWYMRVFGEPPVIYDESEVEKSVENIILYLESQSYSDIQVEYLAKERLWDNKKMNLKYIIKVGEKNKD